MSIVEEIWWVRVFDPIDSCLTCAYRSGGECGHPDHEGEELKDGGWRCQDWEYMTGLGE